MKPSRNIDEFADAYPLRDLNSSHKRHLQLQPSPEQLEAVAFEPSVPSHHFKDRYDTTWVDSKQEDPNSSQLKKVGVAGLAACSSTPPNRGSKAQLTSSLLKPTDAETDTTEDDVPILLPKVYQNSKTKQSNPFFSASTSKNSTFPDAVPVQRPNASTLSPSPMPRTTQEAANSPPRTPTKPIRLNTRFVSSSPIQTAIRISPDSPNRQRIIDIKRSPSKGSSLRTIGETEPESPPSLPIQRLPSLPYSGQRPAALQPAISRAYTPTHNRPAASEAVISTQSIPTHSCRSSSPLAGSRPYETLPPGLPLIYVPEYTPNEPLSRWLTILAGFIIYFSTQGLNQAYGVFQAYYQLEHLHPSSTLISLIGSTQISLLFFTCVLTGALASKGHSKAVLTWGSLLLVLSTFISGYGDRWWHFMLLQGLATGIGIGLVYGAGTTLANEIAPEIQGLGMSIMSAGGAIGRSSLACLSNEYADSKAGGIVFSVIEGQLLYKIGFPWTLRGEFGSKLPKLRFRLTEHSDLLPPFRHPARRQPPSPPPASPCRSALSTVPGPLSAFPGDLSGPSFLPFRHLPRRPALWDLFPLLLRDYTHRSSVPLSLTNSQDVIAGIDSAKISWPAATSTLVAFNAGSLLGRFAPSLPLRFPLLPSSAAAAAIVGGCLLFIGSMTNYAGTILVTSFYGACIGVIQSLYGPIVAWVCEEKRPCKRLDCVLQASGLACLVGPPLGGWLIERVAQGYFAVQMFAGGMVVLGGFLLVGAVWAKKSPAAMVV